MFLIFFGIRPFGKVDAVPGVFWVSTQFFHLFWFPLIPIASFVMMPHESGKPHGVKIRMNGKSVAAAYLRGVLLLVVFYAVWLSCFTALGAFRVDNPGQALALGAVLAVACAGLAAWTWRMPGFGRAVYERALTLAPTLGVAPEVIDRAFGVAPRATPVATAQRV